MIAFVCVASGCGGGGGNSSLPGVYSVSTLAVPADCSYSEAWLADNSGRTVGIVPNESGWSLCLWQSDGSDFRLLSLSDEALYYVANKLSWFPTMPMLRMNNRGWVVCQPENGPPFVLNLLTGTTALTLTALPGASRCMPADVNDSGVCVGSFESDSNYAGDPLPMMWTADGQPKKLALPEGCTGGRAVAVNNSGQILGSVWSVDPQHYSPSPHSVVWNPDGSVARTIKPPAGEESYGAGAVLISDNGYVVISAQIVTQPLYELVSPTGKVTPLYDRRDSSFVTVKAINSRGQVVGNSDAGPVICNPDGSMIELPTPSEQVQCYAQDIDDNGAVVGTANTAGEERRWAVRWTPAR